MMITPHQIKQAAEFLKKGKLVAFPTETVYGLGGDALSGEAAAAIYEAKGRPRFNPLIVHVASPEEAEQYAVFGEAAKKLAAVFWPGPLTLVLPRREDCRLSLLVSAGLDTVAIRVPAHPAARALLQESGLPVAAPSANRSGRVSPTRAEHVREELGDRVAMILDGGPCEVGIESTVVDVSGGAPAILRPGFVTAEQVQTILPPSAGGDQEGGRFPHHSAKDFASQNPSLVTSPASGGGNKSPGMLEKHYAPSKPLRLNATDVKPGEALLAFGTVAPSLTLPPEGKGSSEAAGGGLIMENLSPGGDLKEAAANLFAMLRRLDAGDAVSIAAMPIPEEGLGAAINDRLRRAAA